MTERVVMPTPVRQPHEDKVRDYRRRSWRRKLEDQVSPATRLYVLLRDRQCFLFRMGVEGHICSDPRGTHSPEDLDRLTLDHVKDGLQMGKRAPSDARHLVAMCHAGNCKPPNKSEREAERAYLAAVEGAREKARFDFEESERDA